jgi:ribosomal protein L13E
MPGERIVKLTPEIDMSPAAVGRRLREVGQLCRLGISLQNAQVLGGVEEIRRRSRPQESSDNLPGGVSAMPKQTTPEG